MIRQLSVCTILCVCSVTCPVITAEEHQRVKPRDIRRVVDNGKHNAFTAMVRWKGDYWLSFRSATDHGTKDGDLIVLRSSDAEQWSEALHLNVLPDDRDPQFLATSQRLFLYDPGRDGGMLKSFVIHTDDGNTWSQPRQVYQDHFIFWKPVARQGKFYATAHISSSDGEKREAHLITSMDGLQWEKVSLIRGGTWESETTIHFNTNNNMIVFLRQIRGSPSSAILESSPPYSQWKNRPSTGLYLAGHSVYTFDGVTYLLSRSSIGNQTGTRIYLFENGTLVPYCDIPSGGDCSYPAAVRIGNEMIVSYYSSHEDSTNIYTCRVPLLGK